MTLISLSTAQPFEYFDRAIIDRKVVDFEKENIHATVQEWFNDYDAETVLYMLHQLEQKGGNSESTKRFIAAVNTLLQYPQKRHKLEANDILKLVLIAEKKLSTLKQTAEPEHLREWPRAIVIDPQERSFFILSKQCGPLNAAGSDKKVTEALEVRITNGTATIQPWARKVNKKEHSISQDEIELTRLFGNLRLSHSYPRKKGGMKTEFFVKEYIYGSLENQYTNLSDIQLYAVFVSIIKELGELHKKGYAHKDLKTRNILIDIYEDGNVEAKIDDFGRMINAETVDTVHQKPHYGTIAFTNPRRVYVELEKSLTPAEHITWWQNADLFAFGCLMYDCLKKEIVPWAQLVKNVTLSKTRDETLATRRVAVDFYRQQYTAYCGEVEAMAPGFKKQLHLLCTKLLHPESKTRISTTDACLNELFKIIEN